MAGLSYGQGSSREHAAICPMYLGVKAVIAKSFERIHAANLINFGILPLVFESDSEYNLIDQGDSLEIPDIRKALQSGRAPDGEKRHQGPQLHRRLCALGAAEKDPAGRRGVESRKARVQVRVRSR